VRTTYSGGILAAFNYLMSTHEEVFVIGQGLWSPWYVGTTMTDLDKTFGRERVIDSPVSELCTTGLGVGAALSGFRPIVVHPRMDFMILATDQIVNQAAKWNHMLGGGNSVPLTIRSIINRGGEQGAQHSQALHAWFAHIPGLRVVMPSTPQDARDLLIASVMCDDPVVFVDDRWLYELESDLPEISEIDLRSVGPAVQREGTDVTLVGCGYATELCRIAATQLAMEGLSSEVIDLRVLNPLDIDPIIASVEKTGLLCAVDGGWRTCGMAGEVIAACVEGMSARGSAPRAARVTLPDAPAPTSKHLEESYYPSAEHVAAQVRKLAG
jgi:acetoin:2,6-dichlorophenolindophenol oxidoreductase subunit beta